MLPAVRLLAPHLPWLAGTAERSSSLKALTYPFREPFLAWGILLGRSSLFQRRVAHVSGIWPSLARRAFPIHIIHPPALPGAALAWRDITAPAQASFLLPELITGAFCCLAAGLLLPLPGVAPFA